VNPLGYRSWVVTWSSAGITILKSILLRADEVIRDEGFELEGAHDRLLLGRKQSFVNSASDPLQSLTTAKSAR